MQESTLKKKIICGRQRYVGRRWFVSVRFLESPLAVFVGNGTALEPPFYTAFRLLKRRKGSL